MKLSQLEQANQYDVQNWLEKKLKLTPYQKDILRRDEIVRFSPFEFYQRPEKEKVSIMWRFTLLLFPIYILILIVINPMKWIVTGKWGYSQKFFDNFHAKWVRKLGL